MVSRCGEGEGGIKIINEQDIIGSRKEILFIFIYAFILAFALPLALSTILSYVLQVILPLHIAAILGSIIALTVSGLIVISQVYNTEKGGIGKK